MSTRNFAPISIEDLKAKIDEVMGDDGPHELLAKLGSDIKVSFDLENFAESPRDFGPKALMGYHTDPNGLTYCGFAAGGDWEHPVFFLVYWDGKKLRGYVPTDGNPWNSITKTAYGNDEDKDLKDAKKRWPETYADSESVESDDFEFDSALIQADIAARILPPGQKVAKAPKPQRNRRPRPDVVRPLPVQDDAFQNHAPKSLQERIESLTYYGTGDEGYELFQSTCSLAYKLFGLGATGKAEVAVSWAEEMAYESRTWADQQGEDEVDKAQGHWGH